jgi:hypothetical protein
MYVPCPWERLQFSSLIKTGGIAGSSYQGLKSIIDGASRTLIMRAWLPMVKSSASREKDDTPPGGFHGLYALGFFQLKTNEELSPPLVPIVR